MDGFSPDVEGPDVADAGDAEDAVLTPELSSLYTVCPTQSENAVVLCLTHE